MRWTHCVGWLAFAQWLCTLQIPQGNELGKWKLCLLMDTLIVITTQWGEAWALLMQKESHSGERSVRNVTEQGYCLSFPQDQKLGKQVASLLALSKGEKDANGNMQLLGETVFFLYWITQLGGLFLQSLGKNPMIMDILSGFFLFSLLLVECNFEEELLWFWWKKAAYSTYSINIYWAFVSGEALC